MISPMTDVCIKDEKLFAQDPINTVKFKRGGRVTQVKSMARQAKSGLLVLMAVILGYAASAGAQSPTPAATPCDPQYMDSLEARAWLEAQREITQNQNLIYKPDSVLEYTCFGGHLQELADHADEMLSETLRWGPINGITPLSMDTALANLVGSALSSYLETNFERTTTGGGTYDLLGGRIPVNGGQAIDYVPPTPIRGGSYNCDVMNRVWMQAKCMDFINTAAEDGFFTFAEYQSQDDKRFLPQRCAAIQTRWQNQINLATVDANTPWTEDNVVAFVNNLKHPGTGSNCNAFPVIETGLVVKRSSPAPTVYREKICINPGCRYVPSGPGTIASPSNTGTCQAVPTN
jgi:hypothetical protein